MQYLHACYHPETPARLFFFGEDPEYLAPKKRGRKPKGRAVSHPHAIPHDILMEALCRYHPSGALSEKTSITLGIPGRHGVPLLSDEAASGEDIVLVQTEIPVLSVPLSHLLHLFPAMDSGHGNGIVCRDSIIIFRYAFGFALECISRERFVPSYGEYGPGIGQWMALLTLADRERLQQLSLALPGICFSWKDREYSPAPVLKSFIDSCMTAVIREAYRHHALAHHRRTRSGSVPAALLLMALQGHVPSGAPIDRSSLEPVSALMRDWLSVLSLDEKSRPFCTGIRLKEPSGTTGDFRLEYFLQAADDPSLVIPAEEVWKNRSGSITCLHHRFENPQENLLADLFRAGKLFLPILDSLRSRTPCGAVLESGMVHPFLSEVAPVLREIGISVLLPAWWKDSSKNPRIRLRVKKTKRKGKKSSGTGIFTMDALLSFEWELSIGDVTLSPDEFNDLIDIKKPLVHIGGKWAAFNPAELKHAVETFLKKYPDGTIPAGEALMLGLNGGDLENLDTEIVPSGTESEEFFSPLLGITGLYRMEKEPVSTAFVGTLRPYQEIGVTWLSFMTGHGLGACLADDMGLGKTVQVIAYLLTRKDRGVLHRNLLICPMSLIGNWLHELARFAPGLSVYVHHGTGRAGDETFGKEIQQYDLVLSTYQVIARDQEFMNRHTWDLIVLDEAQNIKNPSTRQAKAVRALDGKRKIALTGTPVENRLSELWSIMEFLNRGYLGREKTFEREYSVPIEKYHDEEATCRLQRLVHPFILRRLKTDPAIIADLPLKNVMKRYCTLTPEQASLYKVLVDGMLTEVADAEGIARRGMILTTMLRLKQICNHPDAFLDDGHLTQDRSGKTGLLFTLLEDVLASGDAAILFTQFPGFGQRLAELMRTTFHEEVLFLHGKTSRAARDEMVQRFAHHSGPRLFLLSLKAGGVGLNLTRASHVFHIDRWWNPAVEDQATDRAYRIGQKKNVAVHLLINTGTLEERIDLMLEEKRNLAGSILGSGEDWITSLSTEELRDVFSLRSGRAGGP